MEPNYPSWNIIYSLYLNFKFIKFLIYKFVTLKTGDSFSYDPKPFCWIVLLSPIFFFSILIFYTKAHCSNYQTTTLMFIYQTSRFFNMKKRDDMTTITYLISWSTFLLPVIAAVKFELQDMNELIPNDPAPHEGCFAFFP